jgi:hypothetical protein
MAAMGRGFMHAASSTRLIGAASRRAPHPPHRTCRRGLQRSLEVDAFPNPPPRPIRKLELLASPFDA